jgi:hypothetical protein
VLVFYPYCNEPEPLLVRCAQPIRAFYESIADHLRVPVASLRMFTAQGEMPFDERCLLSLDDYAVGYASIYIYICVCVCVCVCGKHSMYTEKHLDPPLTCVTLRGGGALSSM